MGEAARQFMNALEETPRGRILAAAAHLFRVNGYERTTVRDLAQAVGIQSGSIFHHFRTKHDILREVMVEVILFNTARMQQAFDATTDARERILALIRTELTAINGDSGEAMAVLIYEWRSLDAECQQDILKLRADYETLWLRALEAAQSEGLIAPQVDTFLLRRFLTGALGWSNFWFNPEGPLDIDAMAQQALYLVVNC
jgi:AcrR family transcriptional regulator